MLSPSIFEESVTIPPPPKENKAGGLLAVKYLGEVKHPDILVEKSLCIILHCWQAHSASQKNELLFTVNQSFQVPCAFRCQKASTINPSLMET